MSHAYDARIAHERTEILLGRAGLEFLAGRHVAVIGLGGVGGAAAEAIARAGVGHMTIVDYDKAGLSNLNRQLVCTLDALGCPKAVIMGQRIQNINPELKLDMWSEFLNPENIRDRLSTARFDYVLDCIDSVSCKADLVASCQRLGIPVASSLGAGGRLDVTQACITRLKDTHTCGLAFNLRRRLRRMGCSLDYPVVFSPEPAIKPLPQQPIPGDPDAQPRAVNGTISYMPNIFGFMLAGFVIRDMLLEAGFTKKDS
ncbi:MAG: tRNA threonylcarbamoyladenosine dehydratase [Zetaproteobacteria bacterium CG06_land_8_20_14_3_00_59_53]|nr:MAG: tRNA threonylcarbamoyladenosine dehydratase [Zetaproteobacteria bacterium CG2_30_59_37]PIO89831.1 MAG: tRNA threonylcarbamoyladenosine dehydratase [Zetaproteobacteria bacterium CG23_combo_of_CG06-09_8_20_14_all_59_86]PIQ64194.1 MAG: tRNA threonylcarbamoyladenosine dehydratase [Zetaproteobacteria bacterium CG11_big_fil_rev_8_21_14_0_20_59_439]PIU69926.1 MAG: tRNA threonylcarbamoyladenosine dehydratase [Zetaproteobacteria bacterium CG06_land_8_20_14_3_00_59_53]PIU95984.1 MAG: tRNA threony